MEPADNRFFFRSVVGFVRGKYPFREGDPVAFAFEEAVGRKCRGTEEGAFFSLKGVFLSWRLVVAVDFLRGVRFGDDPSGASFSLSDLGLSTPLLSCTYSWRSMVVQKTG